MTTFFQRQPKYKPGDIINDDFKIFEVLSSNLSDVYFCLNTKYNTPMVLKSYDLNQFQKPSFRKAFLNEIRIWISLGQHPNIVKCYFIVEYNNQTFICLEWVQNSSYFGTDLRSWLLNGPLDLKLALRIALHVCNALLYMHSKKHGVLHGDLKPENILIQDSIIAKVTDFGLGRIIKDSALTKSIEKDFQQNELAVVGTPQYMAPELWLGDDIDQRVDIYALGCILFEMVTGKVLFDDDSPQKIRSNHLNFSLGTLDFIDGLPQGLIEILKLCLARNREQRYNTILDLFQELINFHSRTFGDIPNVFQEHFGNFLAMPFRDIPNALQRHFGNFLAISNKSDTRDHHNLGNILTKLELWDDAKREYSEAIKLSPTSPEPHIGMGIVNYKTKDYHTALFHFNEALRIEPTGDGYYHCAVVYEKLGLENDALTYYNLAIKNNPKCYPAHNNLGGYYSDRGQFNEALISYNKAIEINGKNPRAFYNRARLFAENFKEYRKAIVDLEISLNLDPIYEKPWSLLAKCLFELGRIDEAHLRIKDGLAIHPHSGLLLLAKASLLLSQNKINSALGYIKIAAILESPPSELEEEDVNRSPSLMFLYWHERGVHLEKQSQFDLAVVAYKKSIATGVSIARPYIALSSLLFKMGKYEDANLCINDALKIEPDNPTVIKFKGIISAFWGKKIEAIWYIDKAIELGEYVDKDIREPLLEYVQGIPIDGKSVSQNAFIALQDSDTPAQLKECIKKFPFMINILFIEQIEITLNSLLYRYNPIVPDIMLRLAWLRELSKSL